MCLCDSEGPNLPQMVSVVLPIKMAMHWHNYVMVSSHVGHKPVVLCQVHHTSYIFQLTLSFWKDFNNQ